jgi:uncharacterized protein Usg
MYSAFQTSFTVDSICLYLIHRPWIDNELIQLLKDPDYDALKKEYTFWMEKLDGCKKSKNYNANKICYSRASEIIKKHEK